MITKEMFKETVAKNIKKARIAHNLTINELAYLMGLSSGFVGLIENGERGVTAFNLYKLASVFDIDIQKLVAENNAIEYMNESINDKRKKLMSLTSQLDNNELDLFISIFKSFGTYKSTNKNMGLN